MSYLKFQKYFALNSKKSCILNSDYWREISEKSKKILFSCKRR